MFKAMLNMITHDLNFLERFFLTLELHLNFSNIQRITPFFEMPAAEDEEEVPTVWSVQKQTNILLMLELLQVIYSKICVVLAYLV